MGISPGQVAPRFTLPDQDGNWWSLADRIGRPVVLYFYPADDTPGCTQQACEVRDNWTSFTRAGIEVAGISPDDVASHQAFAVRRDLPHRLLADPALKVIKMYDSWGTKSREGVIVEGVIRSSVVIDSDGYIAEVVHGIRPEDQAAWSLEVAESLQGDLEESGGERSRTQ